MKIWTQGENALVRIISPEKDAGTAILKVGSDIWYYLPKVNRTIKAPSSMTMTSWMGSDFTLDDLVKESGLVRDYSLANSFEGKRGEVAVYEYTLTPKARRGGGVGEDCVADSRSEHDARMAGFL